MRARVLGVVALVLMACASPKRDVETICQAESRSGVTLRDAPAKLAAWLDAHVGTSDGKALLDAIDAVTPDARGARLREAAAAQGVGACPLADAYDASASSSGRVADLRALCAANAVDLAAADDAGRMQILRGVVAASSATETRALLARMDAAPPSDRTSILRAEIASVPWPDGSAAPCIAADILARPGRPSLRRAPSPPAGP